MTHDLRNPTEKPSCWWVDTSWISSELSDLVSESDPWILPRGYGTRQRFYGYDFNDIYIYILHYIIIYYCSVLYVILLYYMILNSIIVYDTILYVIILCYTILYFIMLYYIIEYI